MKQKRKNKNEKQGRNVKTKYKTLFQLPPSSPFSYNVI